MAELYAFHRRAQLALHKSTEDLDKRWKRLAPHFGAVDANGVTSAMIAAYMEERAVQGVLKSTINRELAALRHLLRVGAQARPPIVSWEAIPPIKLADESDLVRTVFIDEDVWNRIRAHMAPHLVPLFTLAFWIGWRRGELLSLQRSQVDLEQGTLRLCSGRTKNKEGRLVYLPAEALATLREQEQHTRRLERKWQRVIPWVFHYRGKQFTSYYKGWHRACERAGYQKGDFRPHDFRRTAARAYTRAGVGEQVVMKITGHKTREMFRRYNITTERDLAEAAQRVSQSKTVLRKGRARDKVP
jgi:integrase